MGGQPSRDTQDGSDEEGDVGVVNPGTQFRTLQPAQAQYAPVRTPAGYALPAAVRATSSCLPARCLTPAEVKLRAPSPGARAGYASVPTVAGYASVQGMPAAVAQSAAYVPRTIGQLPQYVSSGAGTDLAVDGQWFSEIVRQLWPHLCHYIGGKLKQVMARMAEKLKNLWTTHLFKDIDRFVARMSSHPITFPIRISWINEMIADAWSFAQPVLQKAVEEYVLPLIRESLPHNMEGLDINPCTLGSAPPRVLNMRTDRRSMLTSAGKKDYLHVLVDLEWRSDMDVSLRGPFGFIDMGLKSIYFRGTVHICLVELLNKIPFVGGISVYMSNPPEIHLDWTGMLDMFDNKTISHLVHSQVSKLIASKVVLPNRIGYQICEDCDIFRMKCPRPRGMLKVTVLRATGLRGDDFRFSTLFNGKRTCDPYVVGILGADKWKTKTVQDGMTRDDRLGVDASWDETYYYLVDEPHDQRFSFTVLDDDLLFGDEPLARAKDLSVFDLLGINETHGQKALSGDITYRSRIPLETLRDGDDDDDSCVEKKGSYRRSREAARDPPSAKKSDAGFMSRVVDAAFEASHAVVGEVRKAASEAATEWKKHSGLKDTWRLRGELELVATWRPLEINSNFLRQWRPGSCSEKAVALLFVGVYGAYSLPPDPATGEKTTYYAVVECLPVLSQKGDEISESQDSVTKQKTAALQIVKAVKRSKAITYHDDKDDKDEIERKIVLLVQNNCPLEVIAEVLGITLKQVELFLSKAAIDETMDLASVEWEKGFNFLIADPRAAIVTVEVFRNKGESLGKFVYPVAQLLSQNLLTDEQKSRPLISETHAGAKVSLRFQLRNFHMGRRYPVADTPYVPRDAGGRIETKPTTVFLDKLGRKRIQVDGLWVDHEEKEKGPGIVEKIGTGVKSAVASAEHAVEKVAETAKNVVHKVEDVIEDAAHEVEHIANKAHDAVLGPNEGEAEAKDSGRLFVHVTSASDLANSDGFLAGVSDPYCIFSIIGKEQSSHFKTPVVNNDLNPVWDYAGTLVGYDQNDSLKIEVWDKDTFPKPDQLLGSATLEAQKFSPSGFDGDLALSDAKGKVAGSVRFRVDLPMQLRVDVLSAHGLPNMDGCLAGTSDPYCICEIVGKEDNSHFKTKVINNCEDPVWNHSGIMYAYLIGDNLKFHVWDKDTFPKPDQLIGSCELHSSKFAQAGFEGELPLDFIAPPNSTASDTGATGSAAPAAKRPASLRIRVAAPVPVGQSFLPGHLAAGSLVQQTGLNAGSADAVGSDALPCQAQQQPQQPLPTETLVERDWRPRPRGPPPLASPRPRERPDLRPLAPAASSAKSASQVGALTALGIRLPSSFAPAAAVSALQTQAVPRSSPAERGAPLQRLAAGSPVHVVQARVPYASVGAAVAPRAVAAFPAAKVAAPPASSPGFHALTCQGMPVCASRSNGVAVGVNPPQQQDLCSVPRSVSMVSTQAPAANSFNVSSFDGFDGYASHRPFVSAVPEDTES
eukprot:TRINITY_DN6334_c0_g2_i1.p1 TRINITY_DN6334_c0_g2~~TRINITY_DN6334_c0_g2_i1.p1  ORF type:complete len:1491 (+),score=333.93 TRINITY_DN6334_c0_g2_i1:65-4537(+)